MLHRWGLSSWYPYSYAGVDFWSIDVVCNYWTWHQIDGWFFWGICQAPPLRNGGLSCGKTLLAPIVRLLALPQAFTHSDASAEVMFYSRYWSSFYSVASHFVLFQYFQSTERWTNCCLVHPVCLITMLQWQRCQPGILVWSSLNSSFFSIDVSSDRITWARYVFCCLSIKSFKGVVLHSCSITSLVIT